MAGSKGAEYLVVLITTPTPEHGRRIAHTLVEERLAACVNVVPGCRSTYRWEGKIVEEEEALMVVKTSRARFAALSRRVAEIHPYSVPEVVALPMLDVADRYAAFLAEGLRDG